MSLLKDTPLLDASSGLAEAEIALVWLLTDPRVLFLDRVGRFGFAPLFSTPKKTSSSCPPLLRGSSSTGGASSVTMDSLATRCLVAPPVVYQVWSMTPILLGQGFFGRFSGKCRVVDLPEI